MALDVMDPATALHWGPFVQAAFDQFQSAPDDVSPTAIANMPEGYALQRTIQMTDFIIEPLGEPKFYGFLAVGGAPRTQVIALRGTATVLEWVNNLHFLPVRFAVLPAGDVAEGFKDLYETLTTMKPGQRAPDPPGGLANQLDPGLPLVVTGHSLGGALATILVADLAINHQLKPQSWTFGSPKVGDAVFAAAYNAEMTISWRIYNVPDIIPLVPIDPFHEYEHVNTGYAVNSTGKTRRTFGCAHELQTYLHMLSGESLPLSAQCRLDTSLS